MIYITGDTHGGIDIEKLNSKNFDCNELNKSDIVIILGDFGFIWDKSKEEQWWLNWLNNKPWTTLFIDGNHENFDLLNKFPTEVWNGGKIHRINGSVIHLMRGQVFEIEHKKFFTFGGGLSIDKNRRTSGKSWWEQEIPNQEEIDEALKNLGRYEFKIDYILTHTAPTWVTAILNQYKIIDPTCTILDTFDKFCYFNKWFFAHFHTDRKIDDEFMCLYNQVYRLT